MDMRAKYIDEIYRAVLTRLLDDMRAYKHVHGLRNEDMSVTLSRTLRSLLEDNGEWREDAVGFIDTEEYELAKRGKCKCYYCNTIWETYDKSLKHDITRWNCNNEYDEDK